MPLPPPRPPPALITTINPTTTTTTITIPPIIAHCFCLLCTERARVGVCPCAWACNPSSRMSAPDCDVLSRPHSPHHPSCACACDALCVTFFGRVTPKVLILEISCRNS
eukprot:363781-Chlamydomonas_euryale.AAC.12